MSGHKMATTTKFFKLKKLFCCKQGVKTFVVKLESIAERFYVFFILNKSTTKI